MTEFQLRYQLELWVRATLHSIYPRTLAPSGRVAQFIRMTFATLLPANDSVHIPKFPRRKAHLPATTDIHNESTDPNQILFFSAWAGKKKGKEPRKKKPKKVHTFDKQG